jgi:two-component system, NtrC family, response regulator AtoC
LLSSATRRLDTEIESGRFRRELYFRINGVGLRLPPLRERKDDLPELMEWFMSKHSIELRKKAPVLSECELALLQSHEWPGNIRELENLARRIVALGDARTAIVELNSIPGPANRAHGEMGGPSLKVAARAASRQAERQLILKALERTHWNRKRATQELQISYKSLLYKIKQTGVVDDRLGAE